MEIKDRKHYFESRLSLAKLKKERRLLRAKIEVNSREAEEIDKALYRFEMDLLKDAIQGDETSSGR